MRLYQREHDVIGIIIDNKDDSITLANPFFVDIHNGEMFPYCVLSEEKVFKIKKDNIDFIVAPKDLVKQEYVEILSFKEKEKTIEDISGTVH